MSNETEIDKPAPNFIRDIIDDDLANGKHQQIVTRFPPEPNGYLHIGHAKSICLNFGLAKQYDGECHLRFDDTNPAKEEHEYIEAIKNDVYWLGFDWDKHLYFASDYFEQFYEYAVQLIKDGKAYVDSLNAEQIREHRGTLKRPGQESPDRNRASDESLKLFTEMRDGKYSDGELVLRAKIDMASPNLNMRDPVMYRILHASHPRTGNKWCIYPMYDWAHGLEDSIEKITHSVCTLEFADHRPLYDWFLEQLGVYHPQQIEFARLNLNYTVMSKRKLLRLVEENHVNGWDDPRLPTIAGLRRRGYTPESIRDFTGRIGVAKANSVVDIAMLDHCLREDLNVRAERRMAVLRPLKLIIDNYPEDKEEMLIGENNPSDEQAGHRQIPFCRELYVERDDFLEEAPRKWFRLAPGKEVRLKHAYYVTCTEVIKNEQGEVTELHCTYDPATRGGWSEDGRKVKGTLHWVSARHAVPIEVRLYDQLFSVESPEAVAKGEDFTANLNPESLEVLTESLAEPELVKSRAGNRFQLLRQGYFCIDPDTTKDKLVLNRTVGLRDSWARIVRTKS